MDIVQVVYAFSVPFCLLCLLCLDFGRRCKHKELKKRVEESEEREVRHVLRLEVSEDRIKELEMKW